ncbi:MAG: HEAT repeat domain-containing protein [Alteromonadaceae bacterium]|nr:HEAT repeat domain-containing protein [Alteromonadaceae bacterium]
MNNTDIIDWKLASLANEACSEMSDEMQNLLNNDVELQNELHFIEQFWQNNAEQAAKPSDKMDADFYQMLSRAQAAQSDSISIKCENTIQPKTSLLSSLKHIFTPKPLMQFASLSLVFVIGFNVNQPQQMSNNADFNGLKQQVSSLNTLLAISMLQKKSASERLTGVAYSKQSDLSDPMLIRQLIDLLESDNSTAVRQAIVKTLAEQDVFQDSESELLSLALREKNTLVQIELFQLLINKGTPTTIKLILEQLKKQDTQPEIQQFIQSKLATSYT